MDCIYVALFFCNRWPPKALYNIAKHSPIRAHIHAHTHTHTHTHMHTHTQGEREQSGLGALLRDTTEHLLSVSP